MRISYWICRYFKACSCNFCQKPLWPDPEPIGRCFFIWNINQIKINSHHKQFQNPAVDNISVAPVLPLSSASHNSATFTFQPHNLMLASQSVTSPGQERQHQRVVTQRHTSQQVILGPSDLLKECEIIPAELGQSWRCWDGWQFLLVALLFPDILIGHSWKNQPLSLSPSQISPLFLQHLHLGYLSMLASQVTRLLSKSLIL